MESPTTTAVSVAPPAPPVPSALVVLVGHAGVLLRPLSGAAAGFMVAAPVAAMRPREPLGHPGLETRPVGAPDQGRRGPPSARPPYRPGSGRCGPGGRRLAGWWG